MTIEKPEIGERHTRLRAGAEFDVVRQFLLRWGDAARGIGDDAVLLSQMPAGRLVATTDSSVENVHFRREWLDAREIGYRAAAAALSDLAAMGASPVGILAAFILPPRWVSEAGALADGIGDAARVAGAEIVGGDLSTGTELAITISALGVVEQPLLRSNARAGDRVYVTGRLGGAGAAVRALLAGDAPSPAHRERFAHPVPRIHEARWLAERGVRAAIDISDGLTADLQHVAAASEVAITIELGAIPTMDGVSALDAAGSGEEYELALTSRVELDTGEFERRFGVELTRIGNVEEGAPGVILRDGDTTVDPPPGYLHFSK